MTAEILSLIGMALTFLLGVFNEYMKAKDVQRQQQDAFDKKQLEFGVIAQRLLEKWNRDAAAAAQAAQSGQDWLDQQGKPKK